MYLDYLKQMLEPLRVYDLEEGAGAAELEVVAEQLDSIFDCLETLIGEMLPATAQDYGLKTFEALLPYRPAMTGIEDRQQAAVSLLRIRNGSFTKALLQQTIGGCGVPANIEESDFAQTVIISFPQNRGVPEGIEKLKERIEKILPCHLSVEYYYLYALWSELMAMAQTWSDAEALAESWRELETVEAEQ